MSKSPKLRRLVVIGAAIAMAALVVGITAGSASAAPAAPTASITFAPCNAGDLEVDVTGGATNLPLAGEVVNVVIEYDVQVSVNHVAVTENPSTHVNGVEVSHDFTNTGPGTLTATVSSPDGHFQTIKATEALVCTGNTTTTVTTTATTPTATSSTTVSTTVSTTPTTATSSTATSSTAATSTTASPTLTDITCPKGKVLNAGKCVRSSTAQSTSSSVHRSTPAPSTSTSVLPPVSSSTASHSRNTYLPVAVAGDDYGVPLGGSSTPIGLVIGLTIGSFLMLGGIVLFRTRKRARQH